MARLFGTDGVRGEVNRYLTPELALALGQAGASYLCKGKREKRLILGRDTRISGDMLEGALLSGMASMGAHVISLGVIPTPGVAFMAQQLKACGGAMISASHNPVGDNGIKFFSHDGYKLWDEEEEEVESIIKGDALAEERRPTGLEIGQKRDYQGACQEYTSYLKSTIKTPLKGLHLVVDAAHGAAAVLGPDLFEELGASVTAIHNQPDGSKINVLCGATHTEDLKRKVLEVRADLGIALDGDADRIILVDEKGEVRDGDYILAICGRYLKEQGALPNNALVATGYSNLGLKDSLARAGIALLEAQNGDRYVLKKMLEEGALLGGEQSGHIIFLAHATTGDGLLSSLQVLEVMQAKDKSLSDLSSVMVKCPQVLKNVSVIRKDWEEEKRILKVIEEGKKALSSHGRIFVRASGTEPVIRVMVEGRDAGSIEAIANAIAAIIQETMSV